MEYTVKKSEGTHIFQWGAIISSAPRDKYPYQSGQMRFGEGVYDPVVDGPGPLLVEGADYMLIMEKEEKDWSVVAQQTLNGVTTFITLPTKAGTYDNLCQFFSLWFGQSEKFPVNIELTNFKCYDENKNNLGLQCSSSAATIVHKGELKTMQVAKQCI